MNDIFKSAEVIDKVELENWLTENAENSKDEENIKNNINKIQSLLGTNIIRIIDSEKTKNSDTYQELIREISKGDNFYVTEGGAEYKLGESSDGTRAVMYTPDSYYRGYTAVFVK